MRTPENTNQPVLSITGGGKNYQVDLAQLTSFLDSVKDRCKIETIKDLSTNIDIISDLVLDGTPDNFDAIELKHPLKLLRELNYLFNSLLMEAN